MDDTIFICGLFENGRQSDVGVIAHKVDHRIHGRSLYQSPVGAEELVSVLSIDGYLSVFAIPFQNFIMKDAEFFPGEAFRSEQVNRILKGISAKGICCLDDLFCLGAIHHDEFGTGDRFIAQVGGGELDTGVPCIEEDAGHGEVSGQPVDINIKDPEVDGCFQIDAAKFFFIPDITGAAIVTLDVNIDFASGRCCNRIAVFVQTTDFKIVRTIRDVLRTIEAIEGFQRTNILHDPSKCSLQPLENCLGKTENTICCVIEGGEETLIINSIFCKLVFLALHVDKVELRVRSFMVGQKVLYLSFQNCEEVVETTVGVVPEYKVCHRVAIDHDPYIDASIGSRCGNIRFLCGCNIGIHVHGRCHVGRRVVLRCHDAKGDKAEDHRNCQHNADNTFSHCVTPFVCFSCSVVRMTNVLT